MPGFAPPPHHDQPQGQQQVGLWWPAADPSRLRAAAHAWRDMARAIDAVDAASQSAAMSALADNEGPAMDAFAAYWQQWSGGSGYLPACSQACIAMADALDRYAQAVDDARRQVEMLVAEVATAVVLGVVLGVFTAGIATVAAAGVSEALIASAALVGVGLSETAAGIAGGILVGAAFGAVDAMAIDAGAIQPEKILLFHEQKDFNWNEVWQWGETGAAGGFVFGGLAVGFRAIIPAADAGIDTAPALRIYAAEGRMTVAESEGALMPGGSGLLYATDGQYEYGNLAQSNLAIMARGDDVAGYWVLPSRYASKFDYVGRVGPSGDGLWEGGGRQFTWAGQIPYEDVGSFRLIPWAGGK